MGVAVIQRIVAMVGITSPGILKDIHPWLSSRAVRGQVTVATGLVLIPGEDRPHTVNLIEPTDDSAASLAAVTPWR